MAANRFGAILLIRSAARKVLAAEAASAVSSRSQAGKLVPASKTSIAMAIAKYLMSQQIDRKRDAKGKSVDLGGRRIIKKKTSTTSSNKEPPRAFPCTLLQETPVLMTA